MRKPFVLAFFLAVLRTFPDCPLKGPQASSDRLHKGNRAGQEGNHIGLPLRDAGRSIVRVGARPCVVALPDGVTAGLMQEVYRLYHAASRQVSSRLPGDRFLSFLAGKPAAPVALTFMADASDASFSPSAAPVWPLPPLDAPETFRVEGISVTRHGEQLLLVNHKAMKGAWSGPIVFYVLLWLNNLRDWTRAHHISGPLNVLWNNPAYRQEAAVYAMIFGIPALGMTLFFLYRNKGSGRTVISRATKTMEAMKHSVVIRSVAISTLRPFFVRRYFVLPMSNTEVSQSFAGVMLTFRQKENAEQVARAIADFLDVPLRDFSKGRMG